MTVHRIITIPFLLISQLILSTSLFASLPQGDPESLGVDPSALASMHRYHQGNVDAQKVAGVVTMMVRKGKVLDVKALGYRDMEAQLPMREDTIVRIYSMTKTIVSAGLMQLLEEGRVSLTDPVGQYIPILANMKVYTGGTMDHLELIDAVRPITINMLLTHTSGLSYGAIGGGRGLVSQMYDHPDYNPFKATNQDEVSEFLSRIPLKFQPGEGWEYSMGIDVIGHVIEVISGQTLGEFLAERFFQPLGMVDTGFIVPEQDRDRLAKLYTVNQQGVLQAIKPQTNGGPIAPFETAGAGLYSTAGDYALFAQMLLNHGRLDGKRYLGKKTVEYMMTNQLAHRENPTNGFSQSDGFGIGGSVKISLSQNNGLGSLGQFGWSGAASTYYTIDPEEDVIFIYLSQHFPYDQFGIYPKIFNSFYQTISE